MTDNKERESEGPTKAQDERYARACEKAMSPSPHSNTDRAGEVVRCNQRLFNIRQRLKTGWYMGAAIEEVADITYLITKLDEAREQKANAESVMHDALNDLAERNTQLEAAKQREIENNFSIMQSERKAKRLEAENQTFKARVEEMERANEKLGEDYVALACDQAIAEGPIEHE